MNLVSDSETEYTGQVFKRLKHNGEEIAGKEFYDCTFADGSFAEATFRKCRFVTCKFQACDLSLARIFGSSFRETIFENSKVIGVNWTDAAWGPKKGFMNSIGFVQCVINYSTFSGLSQPKLKISGCVAKDVDFADADLTQADFTRTDLADSRFFHTNLTEADFTGATHYAISATLNTLKKTKFSLPEAMALLYGLDIILTEPPAV